MRTKPPSVSSSRGVAVVPPVPDPSVLLPEDWEESEELPEEPEDWEEPEELPEEPEDWDELEELPEGVLPEVSEDWGTSSSGI